MWSTELDRLEGLTLTTSDVFDTGPCVDHHAEVVEDVQKRNLVLFLSQSEDDGVDEVNYFDDKIEPHGRAYLKVRRRIQDGQSSANIDR